MENDKNENVNKDENSVLQEGVSPKLTESTAGQKRVSLLIIFTAIATIVMFLIGIWGGLFIKSILLK